MRASCQARRTPTRAVTACAHLKLLRVSRTSIADPVATVLAAAAKPAGRGLLFRARCAIWQPIRQGAQQPGHHPTCGRIDTVSLEDMMMEERNRGWHGSDTFICPGCIDDEYLRRVVANATADEHECSFCTTAPAAAFDVFMQALMVGIDNRFAQADNAGVPWEGGYVSDTYQSWEVATSLRGLRQPSMRWR
jgi:HEPN/RES N-terminal domain 1